MLRAPLTRIPTSLLISSRPLLSNVPYVNANVCNQTPASTHASGPGLSIRHFSRKHPTNDIPKHPPPQQSPTDSANNAPLPSSAQSVDSTTPYLRTPTKWKGTPRLPYINQQDILEALEAHINTTPLQHVFLLWGGKSAGKTGSLITKATEWEKKGHPVIEVDLKGFGGTLAEFTRLLETATTSALARHRRDLPEELMQKALEAQQFRSKGTTSKTWVTARVVKDRLSLMWRSIPDVAVAYLKYIPFFGKTPNAKVLKPTVATGEAVGPWFTSVVAYIAARMRKPKAADFVSIFELLEEVARLQKDRSFLDTILFKPIAELKPPVVIIREIQRLDSLSDDPELGRQVFSRLFEYFEPRKQGQSRVPVIIETSDFLWSCLKQLLSSQESFLAKQMKDWDRAESEDWLVRRTLEGQPGPVFTQAEFDQVWDFCGGHAGTIYLIHSYLIAGTPLDKVIDTIRLEVYGIVAGVVQDGQDLEITTKRESFLSELKAGNYQLPMEKKRSEEMTYFLNRNMLFYDGKMVYPHNKVYKDVITDYLDQNVNK